MTTRASDYPLVSIVVPVFNGGHYLRECLDSILAQTYSGLEVLVMDDASTDDTPTIIASYGDRLRFFRQDLNCGIYDNANRGISESRGEFIAVYHADDIYEPTIVEKEVAFLQTFPESGAVFCMDSFIDRQGEEYDRLDLIPELRGGRPLNYNRIFNALLTHKNTFIVCPTAMVRTSVYHEVGPYDQKKWRNTADLDMWLRISHKYPIGILEDHLLRYRHGHGNSSQRYHKLRTEEERFFAIMDHYLDRGGRQLTNATSLAAYEAHRCWDRMRRAINSYVKGERQSALQLLRTVQVRQILGSPQVQRIRLIVLLMGLHVVFRFPRIKFCADLFYRRWNTKRIPSRKTLTTG